MEDYNSSVVIAPILPIWFRELWKSWQPTESELQRRVAVTSSFYAVTERGLVLVRAESMARANPEPVSRSQYWTGV